MSEGLDNQVADMRTSAVKKEMNATKARGQGTLKRDFASNKHADKVQAGRRIARTLAENGPITIDDVTEEMVKRYNVAPEKGKRQHQWKGGIFATGEWVQVGSEPSRQVSAHGRPVARWALKSWLKDHTLNGESGAGHVTAFTMTRIYQEFRHLYPKLELETCTWVIGREKLSATVQNTIKVEKGNLYGIPVQYAPGAVGAMLMLPLKD